MAGGTDKENRYYARDRREWRKWLQKHHKTSTGVWLVYYKKDSGKTRVEYADAVEEALCYGWIDSTLNPIDDLCFMQLFTPRKPKSGWSKLNKDRVEKLAGLGLITEAGQEKIDQAKADGSWGKLDHVESFSVPPELQRAFTLNKKAKKYFETLGKTNKKHLLYYVSNVKDPEKKAKRVAEIIEAANEERMPDRFIVRKSKTEAAKAK